MVEDRALALVAPGTSPTTSQFVAALPSRR
jgi:hypothetical protein